MQVPTTITRTIKCTALVLAFGLGAACRPDLTSKVDCDMFEYIGPSFESTAKVGKFGADLESKGEMVRQVDERLKGSLAHWNTVCQEFNAGIRGHEELRSETQKMRGPNAYLWQMDHAADLAAYQKAFQELHGAVVE